MSETRLQPFSGTLAIGFVVGAISAAFSPSGRHEVTLGQLKALVLRRWPKQDRVFLGEELMSVLRALEEDGVLVIRGDKNIDNVSMHIELK